MSVVIFILMIILLIANVQSILFDTIVSFGDGNTDTGNVYNLTNGAWPLVPPYYEGRFSNGPIWIENLNVSNLFNYAYGGATTDDHLVQGFTESHTVQVPSARRQIVNYLSNINTATVNYSDTLYTVWIGANDYFFNPNLTATNVIASILDVVNDLLVFGATNILVMNQPPLQAIPAVVKLNQVDRFRALIMQHNNNLSASLATLPLAMSADIRIFDLYSLISNILTNQSKSIFNNTIDPCWNIENDSIISECTYPDAYIYIDQYHFTTRVHELIANSVCQFLLSTAFSSSSSSSSSLNSRTLSLYKYQILLFLIVFFFIKL